MRIIKKIFLWFFVLLTILSISGIAVIYIYEDDIKDLAIQKLNQQLNTEISVGHVSFSVFEHFPYASVRFPDVKIKESNTSTKANLAEAKEVSLLFNLLDLYRKKYIIKKLFLKEGYVHIRVDEKGTGNYNIFKSNADTSTQDFSLQIEKIQLKNIEIIYDDRSINQYYSGLAPNVLITGKFNERIFDMNMSGKIFVNDINIRKINYLHHIETNFHLLLNINNNNKKYIFTDGALSLEGLNFSISGFVINKPATVFNDLHIQGNSVDLNTFIKLLPKNLSPYFKDMESSGDLDFKLSIKGNLDMSNTPEINISSKLRNGKFTINKKDYGSHSLEKINLLMHYTNGKRRTDSTSGIEIREASATVLSRPLTVYMRIENFVNPELHLNLKVNFPLSELLPFIHTDKIASLSGDLLVDAAFHGKINDFGSIKTISNTNSKGMLTLSQGEIEIKNNPLRCKNISGTFLFDNNDIDIQKMKGNISSSDFMLSGKFKNIIPFFILDNQSIEINARLESENLTLEELMIPSTASPSEDTTAIIKLNPRLICHLQTNINHFHFRNFSAENLKGNFEIKDQILRSDFFSFNALDGLAIAKISMDASPSDILLINADATIKSVNIRKLFHACDNFGQQGLVEKNINGKVDASIHLSSAWTKTLKVDLNRFYVKSTVLIQQGELIDFEPLQALSKYVNINDLKNLKFESLENEIEIKDRMIYIPQMDIKNNALNLSVSGTHSFENMVDYHIRINLGDLLSTRWKKTKHEEFGPEENDESGKTSLFLRMYGPADHATFSIDRTAVKQKISRNLKNEGSAIKKALSDEFGSWFKKGKNTKEDISEGAQEWEKDIPQKNNPAPSTTPVKEKEKEKKGLQKLKDKLKEPVEKDE